MKSAFFVSPIIPQGIHHRPTTTKGTTECQKKYTMPKSFDGSAPQLLKIATQPTLRKTNHATRRVCVRRRERRRAEIIQNAEIVASNVAVMNARRFSSQAAEAAKGKRKKKERKQKLVGGKEMKNNLHMQPLMCVSKFLHCCSTRRRKAKCQTRNSVCR